MTANKSKTLGAVALRFVEKAAQCGSSAALDANMRETLAEVGFKDAAYYRLFAEGRMYPAVHRFGAQKDAWVEHYHSKKYAEIDPRIGLAFRSSQAFTWREALTVAPTRRGPELLADCEALVAPDGLSTPLRTGAGEVGVLVAYAHDPLKLHGEERALLQAISSTYGYAALAMLDGPVLENDAPTLTRRETECLRWVAAGKSEPQIAAILDISPNTVHAHVESSKSKLGASSRAQLVLKAVMLGLLMPGS